MLTLLVPELLGTSPDNYKPLILSINVMPNLARLPRETNASVSFDDLVDFFEARKPWWCKWTRGQFEASVAKSLQSNLIVWVRVPCVEPINVIGFGAFGRWEKKGKVFEVCMAAGDLALSPLAIEHFLNVHPRVDTIVYQRKSKYRKHRLSLNRLLKFL